jgi:arsenite methyltransferase
MQFPEFLLRQLARPHGWFAPVTAFLLNRSNRDQIHRAITALELAPQHQVLDIGFGGGTSFPMLLRACARGKVAGVDPADTMVTRARRIWSREITAMRLQIEQGSAGALPWDEASFDRVLTVNTLYFWEDLEAGLHEIRRVLAPGGVFLASVLPPETLTRWGYVAQGFRVEAPRFYAEALRAAGFDEVRVQETGDRRKSVVVRGTHPQTQAR